MKKLFRVGLFLLMMVVLTSSCLASAANDVNTVSTTGNAQISAMPNVAYISLGVVSKGKTVEFVRSDNAEIMQSIIGALTKYGIGKDDIKTTGFNLQPVYTKDDNKFDQVTGYSLDNTLSIKVADINLLGKIIDDCFSSGANRLNGVSFALTDSKKVQEQLLAKAVADGRAKALVVANSAGRNLGKLLKAEVSLPNFSVGENRMYAKAAIGDSVGSQVFAGSLLFTANVNLTYELL